VPQYVTEVEYSLIQYVARILFIHSPNSDGFCICHISQGSAATQLKCGGIFSNHFITNFPQNAPVKKFWESVNISHKDIGKTLWLTFLGPPCRLQIQCDLSFVPYTRYSHCSGSTNTSSFVRLMPSITATWYAIY